jgi:fumarate hydratase subunit beta
MRIETPLKKEEIRKLRVGDTVYISGEIVTARDRAHMRILEMLRKREKLPVELNGTVIYHCGPIVSMEREKWKIISAGPTTSARMNDLTKEILKNVELMAIIGKGGMSSEVKDSLRGKGVYFAYPGGAGALAAKSIKEVKNVFWSDLGMPEALWVLRVENFGPLVVGIDSHGRSIYDEIERHVEERMKWIKEKIRR